MKKIFFKYKNKVVKHVIKDSQDNTVCRTGGATPNFLKKGKIPGLHLGHIDPGVILCLLKRRGQKPQNFYIEVNISRHLFGMP